jgi:hypothetical protein
LTVYVQPGGHGNGSGTNADPYTSLTIARDALRSRLASMDADAHVVLKDGTYPLSATLELTAADSGRNGHRVSYEAAPGAHPIISGGYHSENCQTLRVGPDLRIEAFVAGGVA